MDARKAWERVACTSVGLFRMGRDAVTSFFDRAYAAGRPKDTEETTACHTQTTRDTTGVEDGE